MAGGLLSGFSLECLRLRPSGCLCGQKPAALSNHPFKVGRLSLRICGIGEPAGTKRQGPPGFQAAEETVQVTFRLSRAIDLLLLREHAQCRHALEARQLSRFLVSPQSGDLRARSRTSSAKRMAAATGA